MMKETLCRRRCLLKISKNYTGFEAETNVFAEHSLFIAPSSSLNQCVNLRCSGQCLLNGFDECAHHDAPDGHCIERAILVIFRAPHWEIGPNSMGL
jgi:hypothetical protein